jgi:hypothetical protein
MVFRDFVDLETANDLVGGVVLAYWSRAHFWAEQRRQHTEQRRIPGMVRMADETHCRASSNARLLTRARIEDRRFSDRVLNAKRIRFFFQGAFGRGLLGVEFQE